MSNDSHSMTKELQRVNALHKRIAEKYQNYTPVCNQPNCLWCEDVLEEMKVYANDVRLDLAIKQVEVDDLVFRWDESNKAAEARVKVLMEVIQQARALLLESAEPFDKAALVLAAADTGGKDG